VGISNYKPQEAAQAIRILKQLGTPCLIHQPKYSMFVRWVEEEGLLDLLGEEGVGCIPFSPLAQGLLTDKYLSGIPADSRVAMAPGNGALEQDEITESNISRVRQLNEIAQQRGQKLVQMALAWVLRHKEVTSVLVGASKPEQVTDAVKCLENLSFSNEELNSINSILTT
jgi:L-glyceraldehyde 3-phosphate reductase